MDERNKEISKPGFLESITGVAREVATNVSVYKAIFWPGYAVHKARKISAAYNQVEADGGRISQRNEAGLDLLMLSGLCNLLVYGAASANVLKIAYAMVAL